MAGGHDVGRQGERRQAGKRDASEQRVSAPHEDAEHEQRFAEAEVERGEQPEVAARKYPERAEDAERDARGACATQALFEKIAAKSAVNAGFVGTMSAARLASTSCKPALKSTL